MKYFACLTLLLTSFFSSGQKVLTTFDKILVAESFDNVSEGWDYRNTSKEVFINSDGSYVMKRLSADLFSVSIPKLHQALSEYEVIFTFKFGPKAKGRKKQQGGLVISAGEDGQNALIIEFNNKKRYSLWRLADGKKTAISEDVPITWNKSSLILKKEASIVAVKYSKGICDIYVNKIYLTSFETGDAIVGRPGFYLGPNSQMSIEMFRWSVNSRNFSKERKANEGIDANAQGDGFQEMVLIFKNKIETQQTLIEKLEAKLAICQARKGSDSSALNEIDALNAKYSQSQRKNAQLQNELDQLKKRMVYLEALKEQMEKDPNGDLVLSLTELLADERKKVNELIKKNSALEAEINQIKKD